MFNCTMLRALGSLLFFIDRERNDGDHQYLGSNPNLGTSLFNL